MFTGSKPNHNRRLPDPVRFVLQVVAMACLGAVATFGQCTLGGYGSSWITSGGGNWFNGTNWSTNTSPNNLFTNACITNGTAIAPTSVTLWEAPASIASLELAANNALTIAGPTLTVAGPQILNAGAVALTNGGNLFLNSESPDTFTTLSGGGTVTLNNGNLVVGLPSTYQYLSNVDNTIQGSGTIGNTNPLNWPWQSGFGLNNGGTVNANTSGATLTLNRSVSNSGLLAATNGGILSVNGYTIVNGSNYNTGLYISNSSSGNITAAGGTVNLLGASVSGGALTTKNGGVLNASGATLDSITLSAGSTLTNLNHSLEGYSPDFQVQGSLVNQGNIRIEDGHMNVSGDATLSGGGTVTLAGTYQTYFGLGGGGTLHNVDNTIQGSGQITLALDNRAGGTVNGTALTLAGPVTNAGLLQGQLQITGTVDNSGGKIMGNAQLSDTGIVQGGTLAGQFESFGGLLDGWTQGAITLSAGSTLTGSFQMRGSLVNQGNIQIDYGGTLGGGGSLSGGGTVTLNNARLNAGLYNADNTIQGWGTIGVTGGGFSNSGTVNANQPYTGGLTIYGYVYNTGLLEATSRGELYLATDVFNTGGTITADGSGSRVSVAGTVRGGTLNVINGGSLSVSGLDGSDNYPGNGAVTLSAGSTLSLNGPVSGLLVNQGTINGSMSLVGNTTLTGGGTISLNSLAPAADRGGLTLHNVDNTIYGVTQIGLNGCCYGQQTPMNLLNDTGGTIDAGSYSTTTISNTTLTNNGTLQTGAYGRMHIDSTSTLTNFSGGTLTGGTYNMQGGLLQLDSLGTTGGEITRNAATVVLSGPNAGFVDANNLNAFANFQDNLAGGSFTLRDGQAFTTTPGGTGDFNNEGSVEVGSGSSFTTSGSGNYVQSGAGSSTKVDGTLNAGADGAGTVFINGGILSGLGIINGNVIIGPDGTLSPGDSPGTIDINGSYTQFGTLIEEFGGTLFSQYDRVLASGGIHLEPGSTLDIVLVNGFLPAQGEFNIFGGTVDGKFTNVNFLNMPAGYVFSLDYSNPNEVMLDVSATPEPAEYLPVIGIVAALVGRKLRNRRRTAPASQ